MRIYCLLFPEYETLDLMGAVEFLARLPQAELHYVSEFGGLIRSKQGFKVMSDKLLELEPNSVLLIPGGFGTRALAYNQSFLQKLSLWIEQSQFCLSVCTGSALVAATGKLDNHKATSNKKALEWVKSVRPQVDWKPVARWVKSGKFYTSSGVSAGMDSFRLYRRPIWASLSTRHCQPYGISLGE